MKAWFFTLFFIIATAEAQDPTTYFNLFDNKVYSLKTKGVKDFVVDISSSKLTQQINEQKTFGHVKSLIFRTYWTSSPERLAIEVIGLPEGFKEVKEDLKASVLPLMESLLPQTMAQRFPGYKFSPGQGAKEFIAVDTTGIAPIPSYIIKFDAEDKLTEIIGRKPVGEWSLKFDLSKKAFSDGKWVINTSTSNGQENGQTLITTRRHEYGTSNGIGVLSKVSVTMEQKFAKPETKPVVYSEDIAFSNYQIDSGAALKHFLGESKAP